MNRLPNHAVSALLIAIMALGGFLRLYGLQQQGISHDEPLHIYAARSYLDSGDFALPSGLIYDRAKFFTLTVAASLTTFGDSIFAARLPSVAFGIMTIFVIYSLGQAFIGRAASLIAALLVATLPAEIVWSRTCRMYAMYQFFYLLTAYYFFSGLERGPGGGFLSRALNPLLARFPTVAQWQFNWDCMTLAAGALLVALSLHRSAVAFALYSSTFAIVMLLWELANRGKVYVIHSRYFAVLGLLGLALMTVTVAPGLRRAVLEILNYYPPWAHGHFPSPWYYVSFFMSENLFPFNIFFLLGCLSIVMHPTRSGVYLLAIVASALAAHSFATNVQRPRYVYDVLPLVALIAGGGACSLFRVFRLRQLRQLGATKRVRGMSVIGTASGVILLTVSMAGSSGIRSSFENWEWESYQFGGPYNVMWSEACRYLRKVREPMQSLISTIPLAARYSLCGVAKYNLDNGESHTFTDIVDTPLKRYPFTQGPAIVDLEGLLYVLERETSVWLIVDAQRFNNPANVPRPIREYVTSRAEEKWVSKDGTAIIYFLATVKPLKLCSCRF